MQNVPEHPMPETDKYREKRGREAAEKDNDSKFLDKTALDEDLIEVDATREDDSEGIVNSEHPENEEWHVREEQNRH